MADTPVPAAPAAPATDVATNTGTDTGLDTAGLDAEEAAEAAAAPKSNKKKYKLKVDNEDVEEELDLSNDEDIRKHLQLSKAAQKRMQEAAKLRKQDENLKAELTEFFKILKSDPRRILSDPSIGIDLKQFAQDIINQEIEEAQKSPEQKEKELQLKEFEELKKSKEEMTKQIDQERMLRIQNDYARQIDDEITDALRATDMPKKPYIVKRIAENLAIAIENGMHDISVKDIIPIVQKQYMEDLREMFDSYPEEVLESLLGQGNVDRLRKHRLKKVRKSVDSVKNVKEVSAKPKEEKDDKKAKIRSGDFFKNL